MKHILARANLDVLRQFASSRVLLAFDFDGTLAPIVSDPARAAMRTTTRALLRAVARRFPCAVISGRARPDVLRKLRGVPAVEIIGNHGIEPWQASPRGLPVVQRWQKALAQRLGHLPGVHTEDKGYTITVHYRQSRQKKLVRAAISGAVSALGDVRLIPGKQAVNILPSGAPNKGLALERARARYHCDTAVYVGDDDTDEDVFALKQPDRLLTVRIGRKAESSASYFLRDQAEIDQLLRAILNNRPIRRHGVLARIDR